MSKSQDNKPSCFGNLDIVFPESEDGLRCSPDSCFQCELKTDCLRTAMQGDDGNKIREKKVDQAYSAGAIGFLERWSRKKAFNKKKSTPKKQGGPK